MNKLVARAALLSLTLAVAACSESSVNDFVPQHANRQLPPAIVAAMKSKGMEKTSPIMARIFKEEGKVEIWKQKTNGRYDIIASYDICKYSGKLGPKFTEGDRQAPEGFYTVRPSQMNPNSSYHLSFNIGYPNAYDRANGRTGSHLMVHGACSSAGCYSMTDRQMEEIYAFGRDAFHGGQTEFQIQAFPFRMTAANMARYKDDPNYEFWKMLKEGYDHFEITKVPPKVDVCEKRYVFNRVPVDGKSFSPAGTCPAFTQPDGLKMAYQSYQQKYDAAFTTALGSRSGAPPLASINGLKEAGIVAEWSKKRTRGERVPIEPPSMAADGSVTVSTRMGRVDSDAGRRMAALEAAAEEKRRTEEEKVAARKRKAEEKAAAEAAALKAEEIPLPAPNPAAAAEPAPEAPASAGLLGRVTRRVTGLFGS